MTDTTITSAPLPAYTPASVLREALDTIKATYWIRGTEFEGASQYDYATEKEWSIYLSTQPKYKLFGDESDEYGKRAITGVCSIGAMSMARAVIRGESELQSYEQLVKYDWVSYHAGAVLCRAIVESGKGYHGVGLGWSSQIAGWNDSVDRASVVETFETALKSPLLEHEETVVITIGGLPIYWAFEDVSTAQSFINLRDELLYCEISDRLNRLDAMDDCQRSLLKARSWYKGERAEVVIVNQESFVGAMAV